MRNIISVIRTVADAEYQQKTWAKGCGKMWETYGEEMSVLFDDMQGLQVIQAPHEAQGLTSEQSSALSNLELRMDRFSEACRPNRDVRYEDLVSSEEWSKIVEEAGAFLRLLAPSPNP